MTSITQQLYHFLSACAGNWRNAVFIAEAGKEVSSDYLLSANRDGQPVVMSVERFRQLTGENVDPTECCEQLSAEGFKTLYAQYLLWHVPSVKDDPFRFLSQGGSSLNHPGA